MDVRTFETAFIAFCEEARFHLRMKNDSIARTVVGYTPAAQYRQQLLHQRPEEELLSPLYAPYEAFHPNYTGDREDLGEYLEKSFALSRRKYEAGYRDSSLHHQVLELEKEGSDISLSFINFPALILGQSEEQGLRVMMEIISRLTGKAVRTEGVDAGELIHYRPLNATYPNLALEEPRRRVQAMPSVVNGIHEHTEEEPLWRTAELPALEAPGPHSWLYPPKAEGRRFKERGSLFPRQNPMTVGEVLCFAYFNPKEVAGKRFIALGSWHGGAIYDAYRPSMEIAEDGSIILGRHGSTKKMEGDGAFLEVDFTGDDIVILPISPNAVSGHHGRVVPMYSTIFRPKEAMPIANPAASPAATIVAAREPAAAVQ